MDLRSHKSQVVSREMGECLKCELGIQSFVECSAKTRDGIQLAFTSCIRAVLENTKVSKRKRWRKKKCVMM
jgi:GTPase SAR1 family protein